MRSKGQSGFTLIELLVVIAILGVLAGVVVFAVGGVSANAKKTACKTERKTVETAMEAYKADNGAYPVGLVNLQTSTPSYLKTDPSANFTYVASSGVISGIPAVGGKYNGVTLADCTNT
ncbi:MAG: prepilin-type N-terminal cleavage/methylation domain-containing protein [Actinobacteria bacterium]|nr:prepilin-type N-terminal cleavage/methylation domain-containing protein [Actinomycetota bacterium]